MFQKKPITPFIFFSIVLLLLQFPSKIYGQEHSKQLRFSEVYKEFPREEKNLRKWGAENLKIYSLDDMRTIVNPTIKIGSTEFPVTFNKEKNKSQIKTKVHS